MKSGARNANLSIFTPKNAAGIFGRVSFLVGKSSSHAWHAATSSRPARDLSPMPPRHRRLSLPHPQEPRYQYRKPRASFIVALTRTIPAFPNTPFNHGGKPLPASRSIPARRNSSCTAHASIPQPSSSGRRHEFDFLLKSVSIHHLPLDFLISSLPHPKPEKPLYFRPPSPFSPFFRPSQILCPCLSPMNCCFQLPEL